MRWGLELAVSSFIWILIILAWAGLDLELLSRNEFYGTAWFFFMGNCDYALIALSLDFHNFEIDKTVGCSWALILWWDLRTFKDLFKPHSLRPCATSLRNIWSLFCKLAKGVLNVSQFKRNRPNRVQQALGTFEVCLQTYWTRFTC